MRFKQYLTENEEFEVPHKSGKSKIKTNIHPEDRTLKNVPRDGKKKSKCRWQDWIGVKGNPGKGYDGKYYGYTHRGVHGIGVGDVIEKGHLGYKGDGKPYTIKTEEEAKKQAERFMRSIS